MRIGSHCYLESEVLLDAFLVQIVDCCAVHGYLDFHNPDLHNYEMKFGKNFCSSHSKCLLCNSRKRTETCRFWNRQLRGGLCVHRKLSNGPFLGGLRVHRAPNTVQWAVLEGGTRTPKTVQWTVLGRRGGYAYTGKCPLDRFGRNTSMSIRDPPSGDYFGGDNSIFRSARREYFSGNYSTDRS